MAEMKLITLGERLVGSDELFLQQTFEIYKEDGKVGLYFHLHHKYLRNKLGRITDESKELTIKEAAEKAYYDYCLKAAEGYRKIGIYNRAEFIMTLPKQDFKINASKMNLLKSYIVKEYFDSQIEQEKNTIWTDYEQVYQQKKNQKKTPK